MNLKKSLSLLLAGAMALSLAACGAKEEPAASAPAASAPAASAPAAAETVDITLATYPIGKWSDEATVNGLIADFNAVHPEINVTVQYLDYTNGDDTVNTAIEAGTAPDVIFEGPERLVANWGAKGYLVDLKDMVDPATYASVINSCTSANGAVYELPLCMTAHCMAINKDLFEAAGAMQYIDQETRTWTTENFLKAVQAVYDYGHENVGVVFCGGQGGDQGNRVLITNLYGEGEFANAEHTAYIANTAENAKALETLYNMDGITFDPAIVGGDEIQLFVQGVLGMATCWNVAQETNNKDLLTFDAYPMAFPSVDGTPSLNGGIWGFGIFDNGNAEKIEAAKTFIKFMADENTKAAVEASGFWSTRKSVTGLYAGDELKEVYGSFMQYMGSYYNVVPGWAAQRTEWWNMLQDIGEGADIATTVAQFEANANAAAKG